MPKPSDQPPDEEAAGRIAQLHATAADDYAGAEQRAAEARTQAGQMRSSGNAGGVTRHTS